MNLRKSDKAMASSASIVATAMHCTCTHAMVNMGMHEGILNYSTLC